MQETHESRGVTTEYNVPVRMRDGVELRVNIFRPDTDEPLPGLLMRTPYGKPEGGMEHLVKAGYVVAVQDFRGRYASSGEFIPFHVEFTHDADDGYDSVEWLADQPWCNGRIGTFGVSYNAWAQWKLASLRPPHLQAMCANSIPIELTGVDWPGAFRPARRIHWWMVAIAPDLRKRAGMPPPHTCDEARQVWTEFEHARWLGFLPWSDFPRYLPPPLDTYAADWLANPSHRAWRFDDLHHDIDVPNLDFSGWYDHCNDSINHLPLMQRNARSEVARTQSRLVIGPWNHVGLGNRQIGQIDSGEQAEMDLQAVTIRWFDHWLKDDDNGVNTDPAVRYFVMGSRTWKAATTWPPEDQQEMVFHLTSDGDAECADGSGGLVADLPPAEASPDRYVYDSRNPVPTLWTPDFFTEPSDRHKLEYREDILYYRTEPLDEEIEIAGYPEVVLYASSSARDTDFFARLVDEHPDGGPALDICSGMVRARHRISTDREDLLTPGEVTEFRIKLGATACRFLRRHRIRLEITSSDFPNYDRNHNTGGNDLTETELREAEQAVHHTAAYPSKLVMRVSE